MCLAIWQFATYQQAKLQLLRYYQCWAGIPGPEVYPRVFSTGMTNTRAGREKFCPRVSDTRGFSRMEIVLIINYPLGTKFPAVIPVENLDDILKVNTRGNTRGRVHVIPVRPVSTGAETRGFTGIIQ